MHLQFPSTWSVSRVQPSPLSHCLLSRTYTCQLLFRTCWRDTTRDLTSDTRTVVWSIHHTTTRTVRYPWLVVFGTVRVPWLGYTWGTRGSTIHYRCPHGQLLSIETHVEPFLLCGFVPSIFLFHLPFPFFVSPFIMKQRKNESQREYIYVGVGTMKD